jgi:hypothetical protein
MPTTNDRMKPEKYFRLITILLCISLYPILTNAQQNDLPTIPIYVKALLVNTVESGTVTPVVGVVSEDVWLNGNKIIPSHSEIFGFSRPEAFRDRIGCNDQFIIACRNGTKLRKLRVHAVVLDRDDANADRCIYGITDGSYGMKGEIINGAFVRVPAGHSFYLYVQQIRSQS